MEWYYEINDAQNGPVDEAVLKRLIEDGTLTGENLVWKTGMDDWTPVGNVMPHMFATIRRIPKPGTAEGGRSPAGRSSSRQAADGDDGFTRQLPAGMRGPFPSASELRAQARAALSGNWGTAVLAFFIFVIIQVGLNVVPVIGWLVSMVLIGPLTLGLAMLFLGLVRGQPISVSTLFDGFQRFGTAFGLFVLTNLIIMFAVGGLLFLAGFLSGFAASATGGDASTGVGLLLIFAIPSYVLGIWLYCHFALIYYIASDEPELGVLDCIKMSGQLMKGLKIKFLLLLLSFLGWHILGTLALGLGVFLSIPYMMAALAAFYEAAAGGEG